MANKIMKRVDPEAAAETAYGFLYRNPCTGCYLEGLCEIKCAGKCKVAKAIKERMRKGGAPNMRQRGRRK